MINLVLPNYVSSKHKINTCEILESGALFDVHGNKTKTCMQYKRTLCIITYLDGGAVSFFMPDFQLRSTGGMHRQ